LFICIEAEAVSNGFFNPLNRLKMNEKIKQLLLKNSKEDLAKMIGISKVTLYTRLEKGNWKKGELALIKTL